MNCKDYVFKLSSGQLKNAPLALKMEARLHCLICKYCRAFTRNDQRLDQIIEDYRDFKVEKEK